MGGHIRLRGVGSRWWGMRRKAKGRFAAQYSGFRWRGRRMHCVPGLAYGNISIPGAVEKIVKTPIVARRKDEARDAVHPPAWSDKENDARFSTGSPNSQHVAVMTPLA